MEVVARGESKISRKSETARGPTLRNQLQRIPILQGALFNTILKFYFWNRVKSTQNGKYWKQPVVALSSYIALQHKIRIKRLNSKVVFILPFKNRKQIHLLLVLHPSAEEKCLCRGRKATFGRHPVGFFCRWSVVQFFCRAARKVGRAMHHRAKPPPVTSLTHVTLSHCCVWNSEEVRRARKVKVVLPRSVISAYS